MKHFFSLLVFVCFLFSVQLAVSQDNIIDEIVWVVGDEPILRSEVETQRLQAQLEGVKFDGDPYCVIPERLAIEKLYLHQADLDSITVDENEIIAEVDKQLTRSINYYGSREKLEEYAKKPISRLREMWMEQARVQNITGTVQRKLISNVTVTPAEVRNYFKKMPLDSLPTIPGEYEVDIITMEPKFSQSEINDIKDRLREFTERINNGESFATLARMYSEDPLSSRVGGELGIKGKAEFLPEFANVAFSLTDPTKVSKIVETEYGYHIIQLIEKLGDRINVRHILLKPKLTNTERNETLLKLDSVADLIRNEKVSFSMAAQYFSADKETMKNGGIMINSSTGTSKFKLEELPQDINKIIYTMHVGEISKPFSMINEKGQELCAIVKLQSNSKAHKASITEDFQALKQLVLEHKKQEIIDNWIREKQKTTYIRIDEKWQNCSFKYPGWIK